MCERYLVFNVICIRSFIDVPLSRIVTVPPTETVLMATKKMLELRVSSAVVTVDNKPQGILTSVPS